MNVLEYGGKIFSVSPNRVYTFDGLERSGELSVDEQEVDGQKPSTYVKGPTLDKVGFNVVIKNSSNLDIRSEIESWMTIKDLAIPHYIILGKKIYGKNKYLLTNVNASDQIVMPTGLISKATIRLEFSEYVRRGIKTADKSEDKRYNPNVSESQLELIEGLEEENFNKNPNYLSAISSGKFTPY